MDAKRDAILEMMISLKQLRNAWIQCKCSFSNIFIECNDYIIGNIETQDEYPFHLSFDDMNVVEWIDGCLERLSEELKTDIDKTNMTIEEFKQKEKYEFECNICKEEVENEINHDEWGSAFVWYENQGEYYGVEYNLCIENGENSSAIYKLKCGIYEFETDYNLSEHYEIDFSDNNWKENLENAMCKALVNFFEL